MHCRILGDNSCVGMVKFDYKRVFRILHIVRLVCMKCWRLDLCFSFVYLVYGHKRSLLKKYCDECKLIVNIKLQMEWRLNMEDKN